MNKILNGKRMMRLLVLLFMFKFYLYFFLFSYFFSYYALIPHCSSIPLGFSYLFHIFFPTLSLAPLQPLKTFWSSYACVCGVVVNFRVLPSLRGVCFHGCSERKQQPRHLRDRVHILWGFITFHSWADWLSCHVWDAWMIFMTVLIL